jgi:response regulator of citrate/malate metabolism
VEELRAQWAQVHQEAEEVLVALDHSERKLRALQHNTNTLPAPKSPAPPRKCQAISEEVKALVRAQLQENHTWEDITHTFQISRSTVQRISAKMHEEEEANRAITAGQVDFFLHFFFFFFLLLTTPSASAACRSCPQCGRAQAQAQW